MAEEKQYQSLYRKYRPQSPRDVLGQEHVVRALMGAVTEGRLAHAFLFCGPRGTGKTSTARILAKMVSCEKGPTAEPCGVCEQCVRIREGQHLDVVEIDAASHGSVDDARELRERAPTSPAMAREKIYIIDEAQRLSPQAFDALLKVFEEPPPGVRFVLATTEPQKMPPTIVGRCQRFDFRRVPVETVAAHLLDVAGKENLELAPETAEAIARHVEGSVRDALSILDQTAVLGAGTIGPEVLETLLGAPDTEVQDQIADAIAVGDTKSVFGIVNRLVQEGHDLRHVTVEALNHFRNLLIVHTAPGQADLLDVTSDEYERLRAQAAKLTPAEISRVISLLLAAQTDMRWTTSPRLTLELALIRASIPEADPAPAGLVSRIERLERVVGVADASAAAPPLAGVAGASAAPAAGDVPSTAETEASAGSAPSDSTEGSAPSDSTEDVGGPAESTRRPAVDDASAPPPPETRSEQRGDSPTSARPSKGGVVDIETIRKSWPTVIQHLRTARQMILATNLESVTPVSFDGETLELVFPPDRKFGVTKVESKESELRTVLQELFGVSPKINCVTREVAAGAPVDEDEAPPTEEEALARVQSELGAEVAPDLES